MQTILGYSLISICVIKPVGWTQRMVKSGDTRRRGCSLWEIRRPLLYSRILVFDPFGLDMHKWSLFSNLDVGMDNGDLSLIRH